MSESAHIHHETGPYSADVAIVGGGPVGTVGDRGSQSGCGFRLMPCSSKASRVHHTPYLRCESGRRVNDAGPGRHHGEIAAMSTTGKPRVAITYCRQCNWMLRAAWMAQELLATFADALGEVALVPGTGGVFRIECAGELLWERERDGGFPDARTLKQRVRDRIDPGRDLGHLDRP